jgi:hypothetical protein
MDPYYDHMHMYGTVPRGQGVDRNMNQLYGRKSLNGLTLGEAGTLLFSAPVMIGAGAALVGITGLLYSELDAYMLGFQRNLSRKQIAKRNAVLGAVLGGLGVASMGYVAIKT